MKSFGFTYNIIILNNALLKKKKRREKCIKLKKDMHVHVQLLKDKSRPYFLGSYNAWILVFKIGELIYGPLSAMY